jgi:hypothetical protein
VAGSSVGLAAVLDGQDADRAAVVVEAEAVVADAQPHLGRLDVLEALNLAYSLKASKDVPES